MYEPRLRRTPFLQMIMRSLISPMSQTVTVSHRENEQTLSLRANAEATITI